MAKIKSVIELARYPVGTTAWSIYMKNNSKNKPESKLPSGISHPRTIYHANSWEHKYSQIPKLHEDNMVTILDMINSRFIPDECVINNIIRDTETGEFMYYCVSCNDRCWLSESQIFDTRAAARIEINRIIGMMIEWLNKCKL